MQKTGDSERKMEIARKTKGGTRFRWAQRFLCVVLSFMLAINFTPFGTFAGDQNVITYSGDGFIVTYVRQNIIPVRFAYDYGIADGYVVHLCAFGVYLFFYGIPDLFY